MEVVLNVSSGIGITNCYISANGVRDNKNVSCEKAINRYLQSQGNSVDITFESITFSVSRGFRKGKTELLRKINGNFPSGQLIAIIGPSGAGKTTLLNILSGFRVSGTEGTIYVQGQPRNLNTFKKMSSYIGHDNHLQKFLTVWENMEFAAHLKLGPYISTEEKHLKIKDILRTLFLEKCSNSRVSCLSGGQQKRLSIALELIDNPLVMFLDEPTTGLDSSSCNQCVKLLHKLTREGKTIICTLHQPSASLFQLFDQVYVLTGGRCIYNGSTRNLVPYLKSVNMPCPQYYNPADYVIELACSSENEKEIINILVETINNGNSCYWIEKPESIVTLTDVKNDINKLANPTPKLVAPQKPSQYQQFKVLLQRDILKTKRNTKIIYIRLLVNIFIGLLNGFLYWQTGSHGGKVLYSYSYLISTLFHNMTTAMMLAVLTFPSEIPALIKEHFNRWYSLKAYVISSTIVDVPMLVIPCILFTLISYLMVGQPLEIHRILMFLTISILVVLVSQGFGLLVGSCFDVVNGVFVGLSMCAPILLLAGLGEALKGLPVNMHWASYISYMKYGLEGLVAAIYGFDRKIIYCPEDEYCHYRYTKTFLKYISIPSDQFWIDVLGLCVMCIVLRILAFIILRYKVTKS